MTARPRHEPCIPVASTLPELTARPLAVGALPGIACAAGVLDEFTGGIPSRADAYNPLVGGASADLRSVVPCSALRVVVGPVAREVSLALKKEA